jgi:hypothetical protein
LPGCDVGCVVAAGLAPGKLNLHWLYRIAKPYHPEPIQRHLVLSGRKLPPPHKNMVGRGLHVSMRGMG